MVNDYGYYDYGVAGEEAISGILGMMMLFLVVYAVMGIFVIVSYVLESLGVYTIAKRRGIKKPWLSWLPIGNLWIWGSIADQYQYVVKGQVKNRRKVLLVLSIISMVLSSVTSGQMFGVLGDIIMNADMLDYMSEAEVVQMMMPMFGAMGLSFVMTVISIVLMVFQYIALYDMFCSCDPSNAVMFLVLSILFGVARPFFIFFSRKKDLGMPPRRDQAAGSYQSAPAQIPAWEQPVSAPEAAEPWSQNEHSGQ